jgi:hypothetical protein
MQPESAPFGAVTFVIHVKSVDNLTAGLAARGRLKPFLRQGIS